MEVFVVVTFSLLLVLSYNFLLKGSVFGVNNSRGSYVGFFLFLQFAIYVIPSSILLNAFDITYFWVAFKVRSETVFVISLFVLCTSILFVWALAVISRIPPLCLKRASFVVDFDHYKARLFVKISLVGLLGLLITQWALSGVGHVLFTSAAFQQSTSLYRHEFSGGAVGSFLKHMSLFVVPFAVAILGSKIFRNGALERLFYLLVAVLIISWSGNKAPVILLLLIYIISRSLSLGGKLISLRSAFSLAIVALLLFFILYQLVLLQYNNFDISTFADYFVQRAFVAQMVGVYEQFNLHLQDVDYILHGVPFAGLFLDYPVFHKDLMLVSEDRAADSAIGIKNTYFLAEAYAMFGWVSLIMSPIWLAVTYSLSYVSVREVFVSFIGCSRNYANGTLPIAYFSVVGVTGGFSDLMLFKLPILILLTLGPFLFLTYFISFTKSKILPTSNDRGAW